MHLKTSLKNVLQGAFVVAMLVFSQTAIATDIPSQLLVNPHIKVKKVHTLTAPKWLQTRPIYMDIVNEGIEPDALIGAESPAAEKVVLQYTHAYDGELKTLRPLAEQIIPLPAQSVVRLQAGGLHLMFVGLKYPLYLGREVPVKLIFKNSAPVYTKAIIQQQVD